MIGIINASPLIFLGRLGSLNLLPQLFDEIITTKIVKDEVLNEESTPEKVALEEAFESWIGIRVPTEDQLMKKLLGLNVHPGEASVLVLAKEFLKKKENTIILIDDLAARDIANTLNIPVIGTLGVLLKSFEKHLISLKECKKLFNQVIEFTNFYISAKLYSQLIEFLSENRRE